MGKDMMLHFTIDSIQTVSVLWEKAMMGFIIDLAILSSNF